MENDVLAGWAVFWGILVAVAAEYQDYLDLDLGQEDLDLDLDQDYLDLDLGLDYSDYQDQIFFRRFFHLLLLIKFEETALLSFYWLPLIG